MYDRILVAVDGSEPSACLDEVIELAPRLRSPLCVLHVTSDFPFVVEMANPEKPAALRDDVERGAGPLLDRSVARIRAAGLAAEARQCKFGTGRVADAIVKEAYQLRCALIVLATHGRGGLARAIAGSTAEEVVRKSPIPVLCLRAEAAAHGRTS